MLQPDPATHAPTPSAPELIGIVTAAPWPDLPPPLHLVPCGARAALFGPAAVAATARDAARGALTRMQMYEASGLIGRLLPVAPGAHITPSDAPAVLARAEEEIQRAQTEVGDAPEYQLRVTWAEDQVLAAFRESPELAPVLAAPRVRAGDIAQAVARLARRLGAVMDDELARVGLVRVDQPRGPGMLLHQALLVPRSSQAALDACLERIDALWSEGLALKLIGPTPPVSFVLFDAVRVDATRLTAARRVLGPIGSLGPKAIAAARRAALRTATGSGAAQAVRDAARDLLLDDGRADPVVWRLDRRSVAPTLPAAVVA
ncbi:MAG: GvpL/GvpF family gas vesicle protein [Rhodobacteraceae bacterium]|nr:GvpL/GvpF family gas vesicle protein [Paracoccaceae bacterium]